MKRIFALLLALALCAAMAVPAMAAGGTITIKNAEAGKTYTVVEVFKAQTAGDESVSYTIDDRDHPRLYNLIKDNVKSTSGILCPFQIIGEPMDGPGGHIHVVEHKPDPSHTEFGRGWLKETYVDSFTPSGGSSAVTGWKGDTAGTTKTATAAQTVVTFDITNMGYYMMLPQDVAGTVGVASVFTATPSAVIYDKNPRTPSDPEKKADKSTVELGEIITYTASFLATNYRTQTEPVMVTEQIKSYYLKDMSTGLRYYKLNSIKGYMKKNADGTFSQPWDGASGDIQHPAYQPTGNGGYDITLPWVDNDGNPLYPSPMYVVAEYQMVADENILTSIANNVGDNKFSPAFIIHDQAEPIGTPPEVKVYTTGLSLFKTDGTNTLDGAEFTLAKVTGGASGETLTYYSVKKAETPGEHNKYNTIVWQSDLANADRIVAKNSTSDQTFAGLKPGTYKLFETKAPEGFTPVADPWIIKISFDEANKEFSALISETPGQEPTQPLNLVSGKLYFSAVIVNSPTQPLPNTGAAGTTMLLLVGGTMFAVTMLFLVTKKRLYNEG